jgi:CheY-like chemotaxis protein
LQAALFTAGYSRSKARRRASGTRLGSILQRENGLGEPIWGAGHDDCGNFLYTSPSQRTRELIMSLARAAHTILVLDDVDLRRDAISEALKRDGYRVVPARSGIEAQWLHERQDWRADLLLTGFAPIEGDGYHPGIAVGALLSRVPIVFMAELDRGESIRRGLIHPTSLYLRHPFPPSVLRRTVREALALSAARPIN